MFLPNDYLFGSWEFPTDVRQDGDDWVASAMGYSAKHEDKDQALNDLNAKLNEAMEKGELRPQM